mgnify:CR=1 FL=1
MNYDDAVKTLEQQGLLVKDGGAVDAYETLQRAKEQAGDNHMISLDVRVNAPVGGPIPVGLVSMVAEQLSDVFELEIAKLGRDNTAFADDVREAISRSQILTRTAFSVGEGKGLGDFIDFNRGDGEPVFTVDMGLANVVGINEEMLTTIADGIKASMERNAKMFSVDDTRLHVSPTDKNVMPALETLLRSAQDETPDDDMTRRRTMN